MSSFSKFVIRFKKEPKDFSWSELTQLLGKLNFEEINNGKTGGSRRKFIHKKKRVMINLYKPHPSPYLKSYALKQVKTKLIEEGVL